ncbi:MAG: DUF1749 domain-containing protein [Nanoarchaeota archaeon]
MAKRLFIIHGWGGSPKELLHENLKKRFSKKGFEVFVLEMPNTNNPKIEEWVQYLNKIVGKSNEDDYFIGHSIGCQAIMRYVESLNENKKIRGCIFIAGWFKLANMESKEEEKIAEPWIKNKINLAKIRKMIKEIIVYLSSNEYYGFVEENSKIFHDKLGAKVIIEKDMGHFTDEEGLEKIAKFVDKLSFQ